MVVMQDGESLIKSVKLPQALTNCGNNIVALGGSQLLYRSESRSAALSIRCKPQLNLSASQDNNIQNVHYISKDIVAI